MRPLFTIPHVVHSYHRDQRLDRYPIREKTKEVMAHIKKEHEYRKQRLEPFERLQTRIQDEISSHEPSSECSVPIRMKHYWYLTRYDKELSYPVHCRFPALDDTIPDIKPVMKDEEIYFDENNEAEDHEFFSVSAFEISPNEKWLAVSIDTKGDEAYKVEFRSLHGKRDKLDRFEAVDVQWMNDSKHVLYTTVDETKRPYRVWRHMMGSNAPDELLLEEPDKRFTVSLSESRNKKIALVHSMSTDTSKVYYMSLSSFDSFHTIHQGKDNVLCEWDQFTRDGVDYWYQVTNDHALEFTCLFKRVDSSVWKVWIPSRMIRLVSVHVFEDVVIWEERVDGNAAVRYAPWGERLLEHSHLLSNPLFSIHISDDELPFRCPFFRINVSSLVEPTRVMDITPSGITVRKVDSIPNYDPSLYKSRKIWVPSDDVDIPVTLVFRGEQTYPSPMVLYGYGSYETCLDLEVSSSRLSLLDRGVIYAIAHVRGGGECGRHWYNQGRLENKENSFHDFISVARYLIKKGWTTADQLAIRGGSAGGMLMGAVANMAPDLFRTVVAEVPFVDVLTTMLDPELPLSIGEREEWGNPEDPNVYHRLKGYSPYDNIRRLPYPSVYITGGLHDSRVGYWEPMKWALALRDAHHHNRVYLHIEGAGHGGSTEKHHQWKDEAEILSFILSEIAL